MIRLLLLLAIVFLAACSSPADSDPTLAPVFMVMCPDIDPGEPPHPCCTGFALGDQVVTANHCVPDEYARIVSRQQWLHTTSDSEIGHVVARDTARDIAWLDAPVDEQLTRGPAIGLDASVSVLTVSGVKRGVAHDHSGLSWLSSADTQMGDSGAAVVDAQGKAVGVLTSCLVPNGDKLCQANSGIFVELP